MGSWKVSLICCGYDDGTVYRDTWESADMFRQAYCNSPHERQGIVSRAA